MFDERIFTGKTDSFLFERHPHTSLIIKTVCVKVELHQNFTVSALFSEFGFSVAFFSSKFRFFSPLRKKTEKNNFDI